MLESSIGIRALLSEQGSSLRASGGPGLAVRGTQTGLRHELRLCRTVGCKDLRRRDVFSTGIAAFGWVANPHIDFPALRLMVAISGDQWRTARRHGDDLRALVVTPERPGVPDSRNRY